MKKKIKKQKRKEQIIILAEEATTKINQNRILSEQIDNYNKQIQMIKNFMNKHSKNNKPNENLINDNKNNDSNNKDIFIKKEFILYFQKLKHSVDELKEATKKIKQKYEANSDIYFDDTVGDNLNYKQIYIDAFILSNSLEQKSNIIKKLKESIHYSKDYNIFREPKRETLINSRYSEDYIDDANSELQRYALYEFKQFNKYKNKCAKKTKKVNNYKKKIDIYRQLINYFGQINNGNNNMNKNGIKNVENDIINKGNKIQSNKIVKNKIIYNKKKYKEEKENYFYNTINVNTFGGLNNDDFGYNLEDLNTYEIDQTLNLNKNIGNKLFSLSNSQLNKTNLSSKDAKKNKKINLPTVEELFDLANNEGEKEAIIDDELHSDEEIVFETKIKSKKKIVSDYLPNIKKTVPNLYFSQIEFNKSKVMNEADLYSHQKRQLKMQNIDENIKAMQKKLKILKRKCKINEQKYETIQNFAKECENDYNRLKAIKVQMSMKQEKVTFMKKEFFNQHTKDIIHEEDELNYQKEMDDYLNDPELNEPYFEQYQNIETEITNRQIEKENNLLKIINNDNIDNNENNKKKYAHIRTHRERKKEKIKRANSK